MEASCHLHPTDVSTPNAAVFENGSILESMIGLPSMTFQHMYHSHDVLLLDREHKALGEGEKTICLPFLVAWSSVFLVA